jgi:hypothetical protein
MYSSVQISKRFLHESMSTKLKLTATFTPDWWITIMKKGNRLFTRVSFNLQDPKRFMRRDQHFWYNLVKQFGVSGATPAQNLKLFSPFLGVHSSSKLPTRVKIILESARRGYRQKRNDGNGPQKKKNSFLDLFPVCSAPDDNTSEEKLRQFCDPIPHHIESPKGMPRKRWFC